MCKTILFDQNVAATWNRLSGKVVPFLDDVKIRYGLTDYKWILDSRSTTADLVDRNTLYAKLFLKPAKSLEFIAIDMVVNNEAASFATE
jgi:hypothetical protein